LFHPRRTRKNTKNKPFFVFFLCPSWINSNQIEALKSAIMPLDPKKIPAELVPLLPLAEK